MSNVAPGRFGGSCCGVSLIVRLDAGSQSCADPRQNSKFGAQPHRSSLNICETELELTAIPPSLGGKVSRFVRRRGIVSGLLRSPNAPHALSISAARTGLPQNVRVTHHGRHCWIHRRSALGES
jgi:hypothetical protein